MLFTIHTSKLTCILFALSFFVSLNLSAKTINLQHVLDEALQKSESLESINKAIKALESEIRSRDVALSPILNADVFAYKDNRQEAFGMPFRDSISSGLDVSLTKPFSTGTTLSLSAGHDLLERDQLNPRQDAAEWEIKLSQSLWRNGFGRTTDYRRTAEQYELLSRRNSLEFEKNQILVNIESAYWDLILAEKELKLRETNIERSKSLVNWTERRRKQFAAESSDLLQVQSLLAQRRLSLLVVQNNLSGAQSSLRQYIPNLSFAQTQVDVADLNKNTSPVMPQRNESPLRLDAIAAIYRAQQAENESNQIYDTNRPLLDIYGSYGTTGVADRFNPAWEQAGRSDYKQEKIGIMFSMNLDGGLRKDQRSAAQFNYESLKVRADGLERASKISWIELLKNITQLKEQIKVSEELTKIQNNKVNAERRRFQQGRTTTLQMTTFEVEATESELTYYRLLVALKKAESLLRLYSYKEQPRESN